MGHVVLHKAGHDIMNKLVRKLIESRESYRHVELGSDLTEFNKMRAGTWN